jgi:hypothetical protein
VSHPARWVWSLYPLNSRACGNLEYVDDGTPPGQTITIQKAQGMLDGRHQTVYLLPGQAKPSPYMGLFTERFYIPTQSNLDLLRRLRPDDDPNRPAWHQIKADLIVAGHEGSMLARSEVPLLLRLLEQIAAGAKRPEPSAIPPPADSPKTITGKTLAGAVAVLEQREAGPQRKQADPRASMEQPWLDDAPEFLANSMALEIPRVLETIKSLPNLSKLLKPDGLIRHMRKAGGRCRVHIGDLMRYCQEHSKEMHSSEDDDLYVQGFEDGQQQGRE